MLKTSASASTGVTAWSVLISMIAFTIIYAILAAIALKLALAQIRNGAPEEAVTAPDAEPAPVFTY